MVVHVGFVSDTHRELPPNASSFNYSLALVLLVSLPACSASPPPPSKSSQLLGQSAAPTPVMGWSTWNPFLCHVTAADVEEAADALVSSGMREVGYHYVNIDDCWAEPTRNAAGELVPDPRAFPGGIAAVADYVHARGLYLGIYTDRGTETCAGRAGSQGHEKQDADTFASWHVDYVKDDNCHSDPNPVVTQDEYTLMSAGLRETGRPILFGLCQHVFNEWGIGIASQWRTTPDLSDTWEDMLFNITHNELVAAYEGPNVWNDPDMLQVGNGGLSATEDQTHFNLWAISAAPLIAGTNLTTMSEATRETLTNEEIIGVDQDPLGLQGVPVSVDGSVWAKPLLADGERAVVLLNTGDDAASISFELSQIGLADGKATVRDLVAHEDLGAITGRYSASVLSHGSLFFKVKGTEPPEPAGTAYLSDLAWIYASNGRSGSVVQRDRNEAGGPLEIHGVTYQHGFGVHGPSAIVERISPSCTSFSAEVGLDDSAGNSGSVVFHVFVDGVVRYESGPVLPETPTRSVEVALDHNSRLKLLVTDDDDGAAFDFGDWADAKVVCGPE
jgi:alpha-galactosidase